MVNRARHLKCEERELDSSTCKNCFKAGRNCDGLHVICKSAIAPAVPKISRGQLEEETFDQFAKRFAPWLGRLTDSAYWVKSVLPAAQGHDSVFSAALAVTALYGMPVNEALPGSDGAQKRYQTAIAWYRNSVNASIGTVANHQSVPDISLLLLTTLLYINIEMRQAHYHNLHGLIRTAFALVYSARTALWKSKDTTVLASLTQLLEGGASLAIDSICIPRSHRDFAIVLALRIASETGAPEYDQLRLELLSIVYDVSDKVIAIECAQKETCCIIFSTGPCAGLSNIGSNQQDKEDIPFERDVASLEDRMRNWYRRFVKFKTGLDPATEPWAIQFRQQSIFFSVRAQWQAHYLNKRLDAVPQEIEERFSTLLGLFEEMALDQIPGYVTDMGIVPPCLTVMWYCRNQAMLDRVMGIFKQYCIYNKNDYMENIQAYLETLVNTDPKDATEIERELFGRKPIIFKKWHGYMCLQYLVRKKPPEF